MGRSRRQHDGRYRPARCAYRTKTSGLLTIAYSAAQWTVFGAAIVGAGAVLCGLVFVSVSMNLNRILGHPTLPVRAWQTLFLLMSPLLIGIFLVAPGQSNTALAWELIVAAVVFSGGRVALDRLSVRLEKDAPLPMVGRLAGLVRSIAPALLSYACVALAGATLLAQGGGGLYWLLPSVLLAFFFGLTNAWALLVEIPL